MTKTDPFVHLHVHTEYSLLDGAGRTKDYFEKAAEDGMPALATTDHGNLYAVPSMLKLGEEHDIKAIPGCEIYLEPEVMGIPRHDVTSMNKAAKENGDDSATGKRYFHQTMLAQNLAGYHNLIAMQSESWMSNFYYKPMTSLEMLDRYSEGIIATSSCLGGVTLQHLMKGDRAAAEAYVGSMLDIYGPERFFIELQDHNIQEQKDTNPVLLEIAKKFNIRAIATNDCHYNNCHDHKSHDALLCLQTGAKIHDTDRFAFNGDDGAHALKTSAEMRALFSYDQSLCDNTLYIAEMCDKIPFGSDMFHMPKFDVPDGHANEDEYLQWVVRKGAHHRWGTPTQEQKDRIDYELGIISTMGFSGYFLVLWDLCRYARSNDIRVGTGRGSAAGSAVAFCCMITDIDPLEYDLLFERFLNPSRISMPDIDLDFDTRRRDDLIKYTAHKYGKDKVAQVITYGRIQARSAVKDAARVLDKDFAVGNAIVKAMPDLQQGRTTPLSACMAESAPDGWEDTWPQAQKVRDLYYDDPESKEVIDTALGLEGLVRSTGIHAAAVIIGDDDLTKYLPIQQTKNKPVTSQWDMHAVEDLGLVKMDYLGLRNLDVITDTINIIYELTGEVVRIADIPLDDHKTFEMLREGKGIGVFQFENSGMRGFMKELKPDTIHDLAAQTSLYRPGPLKMNMHQSYINRKHGLEAITYLHDDAKPILEETLGILTYQESVMRIAQVFAGYSLADADNLRRIVGKKYVDQMADEKEKFCDGCVANGYDRSLGNQWWALIEPFGSYGFNKSHAYSYGMISYQTAYLKANYPAEYFAALLNSVGDIEKAGLYIVEARSMGLDIKAPDINKSKAQFFPEGNVVYVGFSAIKGVGLAPAEAIVAARDDANPYTDFSDFMARGAREGRNKRILEGLIQAGSFDAMHARGGLLDCYEAILASNRTDTKHRDAGIVSISASMGLDDVSAIAIPDRHLDKDVRLKLEKECLGTYVSEHPLDGLIDEVEKESDFTIAELLEIESDVKGKICGVVTVVDEKRTKKGDLMGWVTVEDLTGPIEVLIFPKTWEKGKVFEGDIVTISGNKDGGENKFKAHWVNPIKVTGVTTKPSAKMSGVLIKLATDLMDDLTDEQLADLKKTIIKAKGSRTVYLKASGEDKLIKLSEDYLINPTPLNTVALNRLDSVDSIVTNFKVY